MSTIPCSCGDSDSVLLARNILDDVLADVCRTCDSDARLAAGDGVDGAEDAGRQTVVEIDCSSPDIKVSPVKRTESTGQVGAFTLLLCSVSVV